MGLLPIDNRLQDISDKQMKRVANVPRLKNQKQVRIIIKCQYYELCVVKKGAGV